MSALNDFLKFHKPDLQSEFERKPVNPMTARNKAIKGLDRTRDQFASTEPTKGRKWFKLNNGIVRFEPPFAVGNGPLHFKSEDFNGALAKLRAAVEAGELDDALAAGGADGVGNGRKRASGGGAGWSPERRAKFAKTMAAKKKK